MKKILSLVAFLFVCISSSVTAQTKWTHFRGGFFTKAEVEYLGAVQTDSIPTPNQKKQRNKGPLSSNVVVSYLIGSDSQAYSFTFSYAYDVSSLYLVFPGDESGEVYKFALEQRDNSFILLDRRQVGSVMIQPQTDFYFLTDSGEFYRLKDFSFSLFLSH